MKQIGHLVTRQNIDMIVCKNKIPSIELDNELNLPRWYTAAFLIADEELTVIAAKQYFLFFNHIVDVVEVTPVAIICE